MKITTNNLQAILRLCSISFFALSLSQTVPQFIPDGRPPPVQEVDYVDSILKDLLAGRKPDIFNPNGGNFTDHNALDPFALVNQTSYWDVEGLKAEGSISDISDAQQWLDGYLEQVGGILHMATDAGWRYFTNLTDSNRRVLVDSETVLSTFLTASAKQAKQFDLASFASNHTLQRLLHMLSVEGMNALSESDSAELGDAKSALNSEFLNAAVCQQGHRPPCTIRYNDLNAIAALDRSANIQKYIWQQWREVIGPRSREHYDVVVRINNIGANMNGYSDAGALWRTPYEMAAPTLAHGASVNLEESLEMMWTQIEPLYKQLHAYVRKQLAKRFNAKEEPLLMKDSAIPAELLGTVSGNDWSFIYTESMPFPDVEVSPAAGGAAAIPSWRQPTVSGREMEINEQLVKMNMTAEQMFRRAQSYFTSMGFDALPESFWEESIFMQVYPRDMLCYPWTAFDFKSKDDFRIKACANDITDANLNEAHKIMAQTYYQYSYRDQPVPFREAANPSFSAAISEAVSMLARNPVYMESVIGVKQEKRSTGEHINELYKEALQHVAGLPFHMVVDLWRWQIYDGRVNATDWNSAWWMLRERLQGIRAPLARSELHFDAASTPLITQQDFPTTRNFINYVLAFQVQDALCKTAGSEDITSCNIFSSRQVGESLKSAMSLGSSIPWPDVLEKLTGTRKLDATALLKHFEPLMHWLTQHNLDEDEHIGWEGPGTPFNPSLYKAPVMPDYGQDYGGTGEGPNGLDFLNNGPQVVAVAGEECHASNTICASPSVCNGYQCVCDRPLVPVNGECAEATADNILQGDFDGTILDIVQNELPSTTPKPVVDSYNGSSATRFSIGASIWVTVAYLMLTIR